MDVLCFGLNHKTAHVETRERFAIGDAHLGEFSALLVLRRTHRLSARRIAWLSVAAFTIVLTTLAALSYIHL